MKQHEVFMKLPSELRADRCAFVGRIGSISRALGIGLLVATISTLAMASPPRAGEPAPDCRLQDLRGSTVKLSDLRGKVVVVHFWATWCPHCLSEMPLLQKLEARLRYEGVQILAVNLGEPRRKVERYAREMALSFPILLDARGKAAQAFGVTGLPATVIVDREGRILRSIEMGSLDEKALQELPSIGRENLR
jgi:peroxiredoxin